MIYIIVVDSGKEVIGKQMRQILVASANEHKVKEIRQMLSGLPLTVLSLRDVQFHEHIEETGKSYEENACIKARTVGSRLNMLTMADDSGLEVDALDGRPGIYSARYAQGTDSDRVTALLQELSKVSQEKRTARYQAVIALYLPLRKECLIFTGTSEGRITEQPEGIRGFGYDPVFFSTDLGKTFGHASEEEKNRVSHRARALREVKAYLLKADTI